MSALGYSSVPLVNPNEPEHRRQIVTSLNGHNSGHLNCTLDQTVTASATTTTVVDARISPFTFFGVMAFDANGMADIVAGVYFDNLNNGSAVMHHRSNASVRSLRILLIG